MSVRIVRRCGTRLSTANEPASEIGISRARIQAPSPRLAPSDSYDDR